MNLRYTLLIICTAICISATALDGTWRGKLDLGQVKLTLVFHFSQNGANLPSCTLDSPDQGVKDIPATVNFCSADSISLSVPGIGAYYKAHIENGQITGTFKQGFYSFPLTLEPEMSESMRRPQLPTKPYPYTEKEITFIGADSTILSGTIIIPDNKPNGKYPTVIFVTGSGPQNRDEEIFEHKPFLVIADRLARAGIASFRYDDRGVGASQGDFATATIQTFRDDAAAAVATLRASGIATSIGVIGHSEGGTIAFMLAANKQIDFAVSLAGAAQCGVDIILDQNRDSLIAAGLTSDQIEQSMILIKDVFDAVMSGEVPDPDAIIREKNLTVPALVLQSIKNNINTSASQYFTALLNLDPSEYLSKIECPLMAVNGSKDMQVKASFNLPIISRLVPHANIHEYPELNHLFQHCTTGAVTEYGDIAETFADEVITDIIEFILKTVKND